MFLAVFAYTWTLPVLYTMALPMDPAEQIVKDDAYDVDLALRVWQLAVNTHERHTCIVKCKGWWYKNFAVASEQSTLARMAICAASSEHRSFYRKKVRSV